MDQPSIIVQAPAASPTRLSALEPGDRLTRWEFEQRYAAMPYLKQAELIEGMVYIPSPVRVSHAEFHAQIVGLLSIYSAATPGVHLLDNATVRLDADNKVQPDILLRIASDRGGQSRIGLHEYVEGAPELIIEIAGSSVAYDLHDKLHVYRRNGVYEYGVWHVYEKRMDWFRWIDGAYVTIPPDAAGVICSTIFPGLYLATSALVQGDILRALTIVQQRLATDLHTRFGADLNRRSAKSDKAGNP